MVMKEWLLKCKSGSVIYRRNGFLVGGGGGREGGREGREGCIWKEIQLKTSEGSIEIL